MHDYTSEQKHLEHSTLIRRWNTEDIRRSNIIEHI